jgi:CRISPR/Cas system CMR subunit Cmr4 (Cas7 group RAMP superfamily)
VTKYLKKNQLKRRKDLFWFSFRIFSPWFVDSIILEPVTKQSIMARSSWHRKSAHLMVVRKERERRERKRKREEKGANGLQEYIS